MPETYEIDSLDKKILNALLQDARVPYLEIARKFKVAGGTIHQRVDKMKEAGIIQGSKINIDYQKLGYDVTVFLGIHLKNSKVLAEAIRDLEKMSEVVEVYYTTGNYALLIKIMTKSIQDFHEFLATKLQMSEAIQSTESFINLNQPVQRDLEF